MFRTLVEQTSRFSVIFPLSAALRSMLRGGAVLVAAVIALLLALMFAASSIRANLALCIASQSELSSEHGETNSHAARSLAIQQCID